jgi:hypothetical protein
MGQEVIPFASTAVSLWCMATDVRLVACLDCCESLETGGDQSSLVPLAHMCVILCALHYSTVLSVCVLRRYLKILLVHVGLRPVCM